MIELEANILLNWARWHHLRNDRVQSRKVAEEALEIAIRCEYRLEQAEIYNFLALLDLEENNKALAYVHAQQAQERASCDGPLHSYKKAFDEAQHLLKLIHGS